MKVLSDQIRRIYFVGIGGIGMSALARYFARQGIEVAGYDRDRSELVQALINEGLEVHFEEDVQAMGSPDLVVYTPAVPDDHDQLQAARSAGIAIMKRSEVLGALSRTMQCIAVAGTHGKTTTSTLVTCLLKQAGVDCTAFLGGISVDLGGNFVHGEVPWMIAEADEYDRSFLQLTPQIAVITSLDPDHLDIYGSFGEMKEAYGAFVERVDSEGVLIVHHAAWPALEDALGGQVRERIASGDLRLVRYGDDPGCDYSVRDTATDGYRMVFQLFQRGQPVYDRIRLAMPGKHNVLNATAAWACAAELSRLDPQLDCDIEAGLQSLGTMRGIRRRFEIRHADAQRVIIDDYAHHPRELEAVITAAREQFAGRRITGVFQPHLYSRTRDFHREFAAALSALDVCILVDVYPAREQPMPGVRSEMIFEHVRAKEKYCVGKPALIELLVNVDPEILLLMGAGDLDRMIPNIRQALT